MNFLLEVSRCVKREGFGFEVWVFSILFDFAYFFCVEYQIELKSTSKGGAYNCNCGHYLSVSVIINCSYIMFLVRKERAVDILSSTNWRFHHKSSDSEASYESTVTLLSPRYELRGYMLFLVVNGNRAKRYQASKFVVIHVMLTFLPNFIPVHQLLSSSRRDPIL